MIHQQMLKGKAMEEDKTCKQNLPSRLAILAYQHGQKPENQILQTNIQQSSEMEKDKCLRRHLQTIRIRSIRRLYYQQLWVYKLSQIVHLYFVFVHSTQGVFFLTCHMEHLILLENRSCKIRHCHDTFEMGSRNSFLRRCHGF